MNESTTGRKIASAARLLGLALLLLLLLQACSTYGVIANQPGGQGQGKPSYSISAFQQEAGHRETSVFLSLSGGGTRASALAYGVLKALHETRLPAPGSAETMLDAVQTISAVSGGSFTAAYYGLHGKNIFSDFEDRLLRRNGDAVLFRRFFNPFRWFSSRGRTEMAVDYFNETLFRGATFDDMNQVDGPLIIINSTDLSHGVRFSFIQEYFSLLCSDLGTFPVARAVMASSSVPIVFNPIVVRNHQDCGAEIPSILTEARRRQEKSPQLSLIVDGMTSYYQRDKRPFVHFVDGGITDNLGLRAISGILEISGGAAPLMKAFGRRPPRRIVVISVNAATNPEPSIDQTPKQPSLTETVNAMSDVQLHRYNIETIDRFRRQLDRWAQELTVPGKPVDTYFVQLELNVAALKERRFFLNQIPTGFSLSDEQVDSLIEAGKQLLTENAEFQRLLDDLTSPDSSEHPVNRKP